MRDECRALRLALVLILLAACKHEQAPSVQRGKALITQYGCNSCHNIPGVQGPRGMVGPSLQHMASRESIDGKFPNNPDTMAKWLQNPQAMDPQNSMPNLKVTPDDSRDMAAFLYTLK